MRCIVADFGTALPGTQSANGQATGNDLDPLEAALGTTSAVEPDMNQRMRLPSLLALLLLFAAVALPACVADEASIDRASAASTMDDDEEWMQELADDYMDQHGGCTDVNADNFDSEATVDDGSCSYDSMEEIVDAYIEQNSGCTDANADNFDSEALFDDGSCVYDYLEDIADDYIEENSGCTDEYALNYDPAALFDDGSCEYDPYEPPPGL